MFCQRTNFTTFYKLARFANKMLLYHPYLYNYSIHFSLSQSNRKKIQVLHCMKPPNLSLHLSFVKRYLRVFCDKLRLSDNSQKNLFYDFLTRWFCLRRLLKVFVIIKFYSSYPPNRRGSTTNSKRTF